MRGRDKMGYLISGITDRCTSKIHVNQDKRGAIRLYDVNRTEILLALVADGISNAFEGKYASYNTVLWLLKWAEKYFQKNAFVISNVAAEIQKQLAKYNNLLNAYSEKESDTDTCCTVCGIATDGNDLLIFNAGDSRVYELQNDYAPRQLTKDDIAADGHSIAMHIGGKTDGEIVVNFSRDRFNNNSIYYICTDGMYRRLDFNEWNSQLFSVSDAKDYENLLQNMLKHVRTKGEKDDVTAMILIGSD